tara:strand:- start:57 stop:806 length:750 start_codon:yes stop_codon:yes gene_type:complete
LKLALNIPGFECPEGGRAKELRAIAKKVGVSRVTHSTLSEAEDFSGELHADLADPEWSAREKLVADLGVWEDRPQYNMRYSKSATENEKLFTSRWLPRVFVRVLLWLSALETCIEDKTGPYENETVQNAARRVLSRWYQWFDADGEDPVAGSALPPVAPLTLGTETEGAGGEKRGASLSFYGSDRTVGTGQQAKHQRTEGVKVDGLAASAMLPADSWHGGVSVLHEGAGSPEAEDEMTEIEDILPKLSP